MSLKNAYLRFSASSYKFVVVICICIAGCSSTGQKRNDHEKALEKEREKIADASEKIEDVDDEIGPKQQLLSYLSSIEGKDHYRGGECHRTQPKFRPFVPRPTGTCEDKTEVQRHISGRCNISERCDLVGTMVALDRLPKALGYLANLGCSYSEDENDLAARSAQALSNTFCDIGVSSKDRRRRRSGKAALAYGLARGLACYGKVKSIRTKVDDLSRCMEREAAQCRLSFANWKNTNARNAHDLAAEKAEIERAYERCKVATSGFELRDTSPTAQIERELEELRNLRERAVDQRTTARATISSLEAAAKEARLTREQIRADREKEEEKLRDF